MSAKNAAAALVEYDIAEQVAAIEAAYPMVGFDVERREAIVSLLREVMGTWTLSLAAASADVSEQQVIAALAYHPRLRIGTTAVAQSVAKSLYEAR